MNPYDEPDWERDLELDDDMDLEFELDEAQLYRAAKLADALELAYWDSLDIPEHHFSHEFEHKIEALMQGIKERAEGES